MDRRKSLKLIVTGAVAVPAVVAGCKNEDEKPKPVAADKKDEFTTDRYAEEIAYERGILKDTFFNEHEMATIALLSDIIIPKDAISGSATEAKVPDFIEFIVKDMPEHQLPMRGGLKWLDMQCLKMYGKSFAEGSKEQQIAMVDMIAYPNKVKPGMEPGVKFFNLMRDLTASGFFTSEIGVKDLGYAGNSPNKWNGVPDDVLKQYGLSYTEKEINECVKFV